MDLKTNSETTNSEIESIRLFLMKNKQKVSIKLVLNLQKLHKHSNLLFRNCLLGGDSRKVESEEIMFETFNSLQDKNTYDQGESWIKSTFFSYDKCIFFFKSHTRKHLLNISCSLTINYFLTKFHHATFLTA